MGKKQSNPPPPGIKFRPDPPSRPPYIRTAIKRPTGNNDIFPPPQGDSGIRNTINPYYSNKINNIDERLVLVEQTLAKLLIKHETEYNSRISQISHLRQYRSIIDHDVAFIIDENRELKEKIEKLEHFRDTTVGLWATDKPDLISNNLKEKYHLFEIKE